jgi:hypothetical protein
MYQAVGAGELVGLCSDRVRAPYAALRSIFGEDGDTEDGDGGKVTTEWLLERIEPPSVLVSVSDRQDEDDKSFSLVAFRARPFYDWHVNGSTETEVEDFCRWLSAAVAAWAMAQPGARRLTDASKERINALVRKGLSTIDATREAATWEEVPPSGKAFVWPLVD